MLPLREKIFIYYRILPHLPRKKSRLPQRGTSQIRNDKNLSKRIPRAKVLCVRQEKVGIKRGRKRRDQCQRTNTGTWNKRRYKIVEALNAGKSRTA